MKVYSKLRSGLGMSRWTEIECGEDESHNQHDSGSKPS